MAGFDRNDWILKEMSINELWKAYDEQHDRCRQAFDEGNEELGEQAIESIIRIEKELFERGVM